MAGASNNVAISMNVTTGISPVLAVAVKKGSGMSLSGLAGAYMGALFALQAGGASEQAGTIVINADGSLSINGSITPITGTGSLTLSSVGAISGLDVTVGAVSPDYDLISGADQSAGSNPSIFAAVRTGTSSSLGSVDGQYTAVVYSGNGLSTQDGQILTLLMDGKGNYTYTGTDDLGGNSTSTSGSGTYTVSSNGAVRISTASGNSLSGAVSADGNVIVLYQITSGERPQRAIEVRQWQLAGRLRWRDGGRKESSTQRREAAWRSWPRSSLAAKPISAPARAVGLREPRRECARTQSASIFRSPLLAESSLSGVRRGALQRRYGPADAWHVYGAGQAVRAVSPCGRADAGQLRSRMRECYISRCNRCRRWDSSRASRIRTASSGSGLPKA